MAWTDYLERADKATRNILGGEVYYAPGAGAPVTVTGIFDPQHSHPSGPSEIDQQRGWGPAVFLTLADLPSDPETDTPTITIGGVSYTVRDTHKPGNGEVICLLNRVA
jgi:hypothetical protein